MTIKQHKDVKGCHDCPYQDDEFYCNKYAHSEREDAHVAYFALSKSKPPFCKLVEIIDVMETDNGKEA